MEQALTVTEPQPITTTPSLAQQWEAHLDLLANTEELSADTVRVYKSGLRQFQKWWERRKAGDLQAIGGDAVRQWVAGMRKAGRSISTRQVHLSALRAFCQWLKMRGVITADPTESIKAGKSASKKHKRQALSKEQAGKVLNLTTLSTRDRAMVWLMLHTAARSIELHRAKIEDFREEGEDLVLMVQGKGKRTGDKDPLYIVPEAQAAIREYLAELASRHYTSGPLFVSTRLSATDGKPWGLSRRSLSRMGKEAMRAAGIDQSDITTHSFRHTAISTAIRNGAPLRSVQLMARHASLDTTMIYAHDEDRRKDAAERMIRYE